MENCLSDHDQSKVPPHANHSSSQVKITNSENSDQALKNEKIVPKNNYGPNKMETERKRIPESVYSKQLSGPEIL